MTGTWEGSLEQRPIVLSQPGLGNTVPFLYPDGWAMGPWLAETHPR